MADVTVGFRQLMDVFKEGLTTVTRDDEKVQFWKLTGPTARSRKEQDRTWQIGVAVQRFFAWSCRLFIPHSAGHFLFVRFTLPPGDTGVRWLARGLATVSQGTTRSL